MSYISSLSHEYATSASFAEEINTSVLKVKKVLINAPGAQNLDSSELLQARTKLVDVLKTILLELGPGEEISKMGQRATEMIPEEVIERIRVKHQDTLAYYVEDLKKALSSLSPGNIPNTEVLIVLDDLCDVADNTASTAFRRLWRR